MQKMTGANQGKSVKANKPTNNYESDESEDIRYVDKKPVKSRPVKDKPKQAVYPDR